MDMEAKAICLKVFTLGSQLSSGAFSQTVRGLASSSAVSGLTSILLFEYFTNAKPVCDVNVGITRAPFQGQLRFLFCRISTESVAATLEAVQACGPTFIASARHRHTSTINTENTADPLVVTASKRRII